MGFGNILVEIDALITANQRLNEAAEIYQETMGRVKDAAEDLESKWEGAGKVAFQQHETEADEWHGKMLDVVVEMHDVFLTVVKDYQTMIDNMNTRVQN